MSCTYDPTRDDPSDAYAIVEALDGRFIIELYGHVPETGTYELLENAETDFALYMEFLTYPVGHDRSGQSWKLWQAFIDIKIERGLQV